MPLPPGSPARADGYSHWSWKHDSGGPNFLLRGPGDKSRECSWSSVAAAPSVPAALELTFTCGSGEYTGPGTEDSPWADAGDAPPRAATGAARDAAAKAPPTGDRPRFRAERDGTGALAPDPPTFGSLKDTREHWGSPSDRSPIVRLEQQRRYDAWILRRAGASQPSLGDPSSPSAARPWLLDEPRQPRLRRSSFDRFWIPEATISPEVVRMLEGERSKILEFTYVGLDQQGWWACSMLTGRYCPRPNIFRWSAGAGQFFSDQSAANAGAGRAGAGGAGHRILVFSRDVAGTGLSLTQAMLGAVSAPDPAVQRAIDAEKERQEASDSFVGYSVSLLSGPHAPRTPPAPTPAEAERIKAAAAAAAERASAAVVDAIDEAQARRRRETADVIRAVRPEEVDARLLASARRGRWGARRDLRDKPGLRGLRQLAVDLAAEARESGGSRAAAAHAAAARAGLDEGGLDDAKEQAAVAACAGKSGAAFDDCVLRFFPSPGAGES
jgi:hypothetical protein